MSPKLKENLCGYAFISPWILGFLLLNVGPLLLSLVYSVTAYNFLEEPTFVGLQNYIYMFTKDTGFRNSLLVTCRYVLLYVPSRLALALLVALLLNQRLRGMSFYRTIYYLPSILGSGVATSIMWRMLLAKNGPINSLLLALGIQGPNWLANPSTALVSIVMIPVWAFGSAMVTFLAGLKGIPHEFYEASAIDGASGIRQFFSITLPLLSPVMLFNLVMSVITSFKAFTNAFIMTNGGPVGSTKLYVLNVYENAFKYHRMGYASALTWFLSIIILTVTLLVLKTSPMWVHYQTLKEGK